MISPNPCRRDGIAPFEPAATPSRRTHGQQEVDYIIEDSAGNLVGIEVKKSASPSPGDFKGLRHLAEQKGFLRGILLHTGAESVSFGANFHAIPIGAIWSAL